MIFVFGSNEAGAHGAGAARAALAHGATLGMGFGPSGNTFAIPTKDWRIETLPVSVIGHYVNRFIVYARLEPRFIFQVTRIGCGLAGLKDEVIAPLFHYAPMNCRFDTAWQEILTGIDAKAFGRDDRYWGTF